MKLLLLCLLFAGTVLLSACGPNLQQQVDALQRSNTALNTENQALHVQVKSLQGQIAAYNQAEALARAKAQGMEQARIQAGERLAALAPACDIIPFACSESFKREANAALAQFPPDPNLAIAWSLGTAAVLLGLEVASLSVLFRLYSRSWRPELERARAARELLATADARHAELDRACDTLEPPGNPGLVGVARCRRHARESSPPRPAPGGRDTGRAGGSLLSGASESPFSRLVPGGPP